MELTLIFAVSIFALLFAVFLIKNVMKRDTGTDKMREMPRPLGRGKRISNFLGFSPKNVF